MNESEFIVIQEFINIQVIKKYSLLSHNEYLKTNPISKENNLKRKNSQNPEGFSYGTNGYCKDKLIARISYQKKNFV